MAGHNILVNEFLGNQATPQVDLSSLILGLVLSAVLGYILAKLYTRYGSALSNRKKFSDNFILLTTTTTLIISVVKSSLALSLGLVGALSIVRFRAAIKEPEELAFLFLAIAIGLGFGANQFTTTIVAFAIISLLIYGRHFNLKKEEGQNLYLTVSGEITKDLTLKNVVEIVKKYSMSAKMKRFDQSKGNMVEISFLVDLGSFNDLEKIKIELNKLSKDVSITYLDKSGL
jgi:uncharacterized membrane protein YhiD involved in acid resistance